MPSSPANTGLVLRYIRALRGATAGVESGDGELLQRFAEGRDQAAFAELVRRHGPMIFGLCCRLLRDRHDAEDALQGTFLVLARKAAAIRDGTSLGPWLYRVAFRVALEARAKAARRLAREQREGDMIDERKTAEPSTAELGPASAASQKELRSILDEELNRLPVKYCAPLVLCYLQGKTHREAAQELDFPPGSMKNRLMRACEVLRGRLLRRGVALPAAMLAAVLADQAAPVKLSAATVHRLVESAAAFGQVGASTTVAATLAEGVLRTMTMTKIKLAAVLVTTLGVLATAGAGLLLSSAVDEPALAAPPVAAKPMPPLPRADRYGDPLPDGALARFGSDRFRIRDDELIAFSPDLKRIAWVEASNPESRVILADLDTGKHLRFWDARNRRPGGTPSLSQPVLSMDGKFLAAVEFRDSNVVLWDTATEKELGRLKVPYGSFGIRGLVLAPDSRSFAISTTGEKDNTTIRVCEVPSGRERLKIETTQGMLDALRYSPDGKLLASWGHGNGMSPSGYGVVYPIVLWDAATGKEVRRLDCGKGVTSIAFSPDSRTLYWTGMELNKGKDVSWRKWLAAGPTHVVDVATGQERIAAFRGPAGPLAVSPDGKKLVAQTAGGDELGQWDTLTGKLLGKLQTRGSAVAFSADGKTLAAAGVREVRTWDAATGRELVRRQYDRHCHSVYNLSFGPDGKTLFSGNHSEVFAWDIATTRGRSLPPVGEKSSWEAVVDLSAAGKALMVRQFDKLHFLDPATGKGRRSLTLPGDIYRFTVVALSPDGKIVAGSGSGLGRPLAAPTLYLWDAATGKELRRVEGMERGAGLAFSPDSKVLAASMVLVDVATGKRLGRIGNGQEGKTPISRVAFTSDGRSLVTQHNDGTVRLWELATGQRRREFPGSVFALSRNARFLATLSKYPQTAITVWELPTGRKCREFKAQHGLQAIAFAPDDQSLAAGGDETTILLWDLHPCTKPAPAPEPATKAVESLWTDLGSPDAAKAYQALGALTAMPKQAVSLLAGKLHPVPPTDAAIRKLLTDLDDKRFAVREKARVELEKLGDQAEPALRGVLKNGKPPLELHRRVEELLKKLEQQALSPAMVQRVRAIELLEVIGSPEARKLLERLASGEAEARQTREAKQSLVRLNPN